MKKTVFPFQELSLAIEQANQALRVAIRTAYLNRDLPLDMTYEVKPLPSPDGQENAPLIREVWVYPEITQQAPFKLLSETLQVVTSESGLQLEQTILEV